jgi:hypothetical protein
MFTPSVLDGVSSHAQLARPLGDRQAFALPLDPIREATVPVLLEGIRPSTVIRRVALCILNTIQRKAVWGWSHISVEVDKLTPAWVYNKSLRSVAFKQLGVRIVATLNHACPNAVFPAFVQAMRRAGFCYGRAILAATRLRSRLQMIPAYSVELAARASAQPPLSTVRGVPRGLWHLFNDGQASKDAARQVNDWSPHKGHPIMVF